MDNTFIHQKLFPPFSFNLGLALTGYWTTWPSAWQAQKVPSHFAIAFICQHYSKYIAHKRVCRYTLKTGIVHTIFKAVYAWDLWCTYSECTLVQTLILRKTMELTNEIHRGDCRFSELAPCRGYIGHTEADWPAENTVVATGSSSYAVPVANPYIHLDSWLQMYKSVFHSEREVQLRRLYSMQLFLYLS